MDRHSSSGSRVNGISRYQPDVLVGISDQQHLDPAVHVALAQDLDWRPASQVPDSEDWIAVVVKAIGKDLPREL